MTICKLKVKAGLLAGAAVMALLPAAASALTINGSFALSGDAYSSQRLPILTDVTSGTFSFDLDLGQSATIDLFEIWTSRNNVNNPSRIAKTLLADLSVTGGGSGTLTGATVGAGTLIQYGQVTWGGPVDISFGNGGVLRFALSDETFNAGLGRLNRGQAFGADVTLTATYLVAPVPLPATGLMLIGGLGAVAALRRKRRAA